MCSIPNLGHGAPGDCLAFTPLFKNITGEYQRLYSSRLLTRNRNVGFLRYWTLPNVPLFLLAGPMLYLLAKSGADFFSRPHIINEGMKNSTVSDNLASLIRSMASAQLLLTVLAITNYHTQIITRISSGYPLWYLWLANQLSHDKTAGFGKNFVIFMVMYAGIQGALFASFLPPA